MNVERLAAEAIINHHADQKPAELARFGSLVLECKLTTAVEIGTFRGGTTWFLAALGLSVTTIDISFERVPERLAGVTYLQERSYDAVKRVAPCDLLFIDGDHSYQGVKSDWELYRPKVRPGGLVAFHDIVKHRPEANCHVDRLWGRLRKGQETVEFREPDKGVPWAGIGVVFV